MAKDPIDYTYRGRPAHYDDPQELWNKAVEYFKSVTTTSGIIRATITGVTRHCGFASRTAWHDYAKKSEEFKNTVDMIKMVVVEWYERNLHGYNWAGSAFALRNMDGGNWKDESTVNQHNIVTEIKTEILDPGVKLANNEGEIVP